MDIELAEFVFQHMPKSFNEHHDKQVMDYLENNFDNPKDAYAKLKDFFVQNNKKIYKWVKYFRRGNKIPKDLCLYDHIKWNREKQNHEYIKIPLFVNVFCCNDPQAYLADRYACKPWKQDLNEHYILDRINGARLEISCEEHNKFNSMLAGQISFKKVGKNLFKMLFIPYGYVSGMDEILEIYDNGEFSRWCVSAWPDLGNSAKDKPKAATYRYKIAMNLSTGLFISLFVKILPHIQKYLDSIEKLYDEKYPEKESFIQRIKEYYEYDDDRVSMTCDESGYRIM